MSVLLTVTYRVSGDPEAFKAKATEVAGEGKVTDQITITPAKTAKR